MVLNLSLRTKHDVNVEHHSLRFLCLDSHSRRFRRSERCICLGFESLIDMTSCGNASEILGGFYTGGDSSDAMDFTRSPGTDWNSKYKLNIGNYTYY